MCLGLILFTRLRILLDVRKGPFSRRVRLVLLSVPRLIQSWSWSRLTGRVAEGRTPFSTSSTDWLFSAPRLLPKAPRPAAHTVLDEASPCRPAFLGIWTSQSWPAASERSSPPSFSSCVDGGWRAVFLFRWEGLESLVFSRNRKSLC